MTTIVATVESVETIVQRGGWGFKIFQIWKGCRKRTRQYGDIMGNYGGVYGKRESIVVVMV
jgi:hypothetical protein